MQTAEAYTPEYLTLGGRPVIDVAPNSAAYGATIAIDSTNAPDIADVCVIAPGAITHHTDTHQRYIKLAFAQNGATQLDVRMPSNSDVAPPGYYMLFVLDNMGAPSEATFIQIV